MYLVGIDIGSTASKVAVLRDHEIIETMLMNTGFSSIVTSEAILKRLNELGINEKNSIIIATGYGRVSVPYAYKTITEISCHAKGADFLLGEDCTVIDIGGQDTKAIMLSKGRVSKFIMNDKCSAGTGKFLEVMSNRLGVTQDEMSRLATKGQAIVISSMCTVFAESEVISLIGKGTPREDIAFGVIESVVNKVVQLVSQVSNDKYFLTGGLCDNGYLIERLERALKSPVTSIPMARYAGAIGAALYADN
ncbi:acyl-CoA dehydratase activase [Sedimentibacter sp.]|uniref:acyl-CoA dehydratase activase n=1 Tax=Sedimentibacter sp. TaxID=1960295 RepID=UPI0028968342|nr:acyl-CoA dehydratase activase [Sedimentibacter sp.]